MVDPLFLTLDRTTTWRRRVPLWALRSAVVVPLVVLVALDIAGEAPCTVTDPCRDPIGSVGYLLGAGVVFCTVACVPLALLAPRIAPWPAAVLATASAAVPASDSVVRPGWAAAAVLCVAVAAADVLLRRRQAALAQDWPAVHVRLPVPDEADRRVPLGSDARVTAVVVLAASVLTAVGLFLWHAHAVADVRGFEARAVRVDARVISLADDGYSLRLDVDGRRTTVDALESYRAGDVVPVLADPASPSDVALVAEPRDPSWLLGLAALALLLGGTAALRLWRRGADRAYLVERGGLALRARVGWRPDGLVIGAADDRHLQWPLARVPHDLVPVDALLHPDLDDDLEHDPEDDLEDDDVDAVEGWAWRTDGLDPAGLGDDDLVAWAEGELDLEEEDDDYAGPLPLAPADDGGTLVTVVGLSRDGAPLALLDEDGEAWLTGAVRDPWSKRELLRLAAARLSGGPRRPRTARNRLVQAALPWLERYGTVLAYAAAVVAYPIARWLYGDSPPWWSLLHALWLLLGPAEGLVMLSELGRPALAPHPAGVRHRGLLLARVLPARRVVDVLAGQRTLVFRLTDPDDAVTVPAAAVDPLRRAASAEPTSAERARDLVVRWLAEATAPSPRWTTRPAAALGPALGLFVAVVAAWARPHLGA